MKFNTTAIEAKPGETLHIVLKNTGTVPKVAMAHNFVALKAGVDAAKFSQDAMMAKDTDYVPAARKADVLGSTKLAGPGETVEVTFKVPAKPGVYPYLCTFPGHYRRRNARRPDRQVDRFDHAARCVRRAALSFPLASFLPHPALHPLTRPRRHCRPIMGVPRYGCWRITGQQ